MGVPDKWIGAVIWSIFAVQFWTCRGIRIEIVELQKWFSWDQLHFRMHFSGVRTFSVTSTPPGPATKSLEVVIERMISSSSLGGKPAAVCTRRWSRCGKQDLKCIDTYWYPYIYISIVNSIIVMVMVQTCPNIRFSNINSQWFWLVMVNNLCIRYANRQ